MTNFNQNKYELQHKVTKCGPLKCNNVKKNNLYECAPQKPTFPLNHHFPWTNLKKPIENQITTLEIKISDLQITQTFTHVDFKYPKVKSSTVPRFTTN